MLTVEEQLVTVNERIQEEETLFRAVIASGRIVEDVLAILKAQDQKKEQ